MDRVLLSTRLKREYRCNTTEYIRFLRVNDETSRVKSEFRNLLYKLCAKDWFLWCFFLLVQKIKTGAFILHSRHFIMEAEKHQFRNGENSMLSLKLLHCSTYILLDFQQLCCLPKWCVMRVSNYMYTFAKRSAFQCRKRKPNEWIRCANFNFFIFVICLCRCHHHDFYRCCCGCCYRFLIIMYKNIILDVTA